MEAHFELEAWKVESKTKNPVTGQPCYSLESGTTALCVAHIASLECLVAHMHAAGERQAKEMKRILEGMLSFSTICVL